MLAVLQIDSVSLGVVESMLAEGRLPALASLRERGRWQRLETPATHLVAAAYPTLYSGLEPGEHGFSYPFHWSAAEQRVRAMHAFVHPEPVWERIARAGRRSIVVDAYEAPPPRLPVGAYLSGWGFVHRVVLRGGSEPPSLRRRLARRLGRPPHVEEVFGEPSARRLARMRDRLTAAPARVAAAAITQLAEDRSDLVWLSFPAAHIAGHQLWDLSQLQPGERRRAERAGLGTALPDVYEAVDSAVAKVVATLPDHADLLLVSPAGMGPNASRVEFLDGMLDAVLTGGDGSSGAAPGSALWQLRSALPTGLRAGLAAALPDRAALGLAAALATRGLDWSRTRAFTLPADHHGHIRVNLRGRERLGIVDPAELDELLDEIADGLLSFHDVGGGPAVRSVERAQELFPGARADLLPDLVVSWGEPPSPGLAGVRSPRYGLVSRSGAGSGRSGNHEPDAWVVLAPGRSRIVELSRQPRLSDIAPTVCMALGVEPDGLAGAPLLEASEISARPRPLRSP